MDEQTNKIERMLTSSEVANLLNIHINTVRRWANNGELKAYRIGSRGDRRFRMQDVDLIMKKNFEPEAGSKA